MKKVIVASASVAPTVAAAGQLGLSFPAALVIGIGVAIAIFLVWKFWPASAPHTPVPTPAPAPAPAPAPTNVVPLAPAREPPK